MRYVVIDTETGGTNSWRDSLLTIGVVLVDDDKVQGEKYILVADRPYRCSREALEVNGIDLAEHDKLALPPQEALKELSEFIEPYRVHDGKLIPVGHNLYFDMGFMFRLGRIGGYEHFVQDYFSPVRVCTLQACNLARALQLISLESCKLTTVTGELGIEHVAHNALGDARATAKLLIYLRKKLIWEA